MKHNPRQVILAAALAAATGANAEETRVPYTCDSDDGLSFSQEWSKSEARATLIDNSGTRKVSNARIERGKTYAAFMDSFWLAMEENSAIDKPANVGEMLALVEKSFIQADSEAVGAIKAKGADAALRIAGFGSARTDGNHESILVSARGLKEISLAESPEIFELFSNSDTGRFKYDTGVDIDVQFSYGGSYVGVPIAKEIGRYVDMTTDSDLQAFLGFEETDDYGYGEPKSYWETLNLKDDLACLEAPEVK